MTSRTCALLVGLWAGLGPPAPPTFAQIRNSNATADDGVNTSLAVQTAMQQARESLALGEYRSAVRVLELNLPKINGNPVYLSLLENAYRGYVKDLKQKGQEEQAQKYLERLAILDPGVLLSQAVKPGTAAESAAPKKDDLIVRGRRDEERGVPIAVDTAVKESALAAADREFQGRHFVQAVAFYEKAAQQEPNLPQTTKDRWAYCKLFAVTEKINNPPPTGTNWAVLETEVRHALSLSPRMEFGQSLLKTIQERGKAIKSHSQYRGKIQHYALKLNGWQVAETDNFRVFHHDTPLSEQVLQTAEQTRSTVMAKWLGNADPSAWSVRCDIYLHETAQAYAKSTGVSSESPGHSSIGAEKHDATRVTSRRIDLHVDDTHMVSAVLPHEATHVVLAGQIGRKPIPRWADEGLAVLTEPPERIDRHLQCLPKAYTVGRAFTAEQLLRTEEYPSASQMAYFYGQSVAMVRYLSELHGPQAFVSFLRDAETDGYEAALKKHYGLADLAALDQRWRHYQQVEGSPRTAAVTEKPN